MADLLQKIARQKVIWLLPVAVWMAPAAPFSHKIHLQQKLTCAVCHSSAAASVKAQDNLLPNPAVCAGCHKDAKTVKAPRQSLVTKFHHALHAKQKEIAPLVAKAIDSGKYLGKPGEVHRPDLNTASACAACHRGLQRSDDVSAGHFPHMAECLVCHDRVDPPFSCVKCHEPGSHLKPATHTNDWLDRHSSTKVEKDKQSCLVCHGRNFTCFGCH